MKFSSWFLILFALFGIAFVSAIKASEGDADPIYRDCVEHCELTGCVGSKCFQLCQFTADGNISDGQWYLQEPLYLKWKQWDCRSDCRYNCMLTREEERRIFGERPIKYYGRWPYLRVYGIQEGKLSTSKGKRWMSREPVAVALSALNLAVQFHGWISFFILVYYKLPMMHNQKTYYEYTSLWHMYGILAMNCWFWAAVLHSRDLDVTEKLGYSSSVSLLGFGLVLAIFRAFSLKNEAAKVMVGAPIIALVISHILYLNFYYLDHGLNMKVCSAMGVAQFLVWAVWTGMCPHPSRWKSRVVVFGGALSILLLIYDFPPYWGYVDAHALWHATTIPLSYLWWSFVKDDAEYITMIRSKKDE